MSKSESTSTQPKSIRQKRILDIAADNPSATLAEIAERVPSASADHVDRVLDKYGDPADTGDSGTDDSPPAASDADSTDNPSPDSQDSPDEQVSAEATAQPDEPLAAADQEQDSPSATEPSVTNSQMNPGKKADPNDSAAEPETEVPDDTPESTDSAAETGTEPPDNTTEPTGSDGKSGLSTDETTPEPDDLTQKERETLRAISYEPNATQEQIADMLSISRATVSNRVNAIPGFNWADRDSFVEEVFDEHLTVDDTPDSDDPDSSAANPNAGKETATDGASSALSDPSSGDSLPQEAPSSAPDDVVDDSPSGESASQAAGQDVTTDSSKPSSSDDLTEISHRLEDVAERLATMEQEIQESEETVEASPLSDTDLLHKVVYACMNSDRITEEEELQILDTLMN